MLASALGRRGSEPTSGPAAAQDRVPNHVPNTATHLVLGLLSLKYISDAFEQRRRQIQDELSNQAGDGYIDDPESRAEILRAATRTRREPSPGCPRRRGGRPCSQRHHTLA